MNYSAIANSARFSIPAFNEKTGLARAVIEAPRGSCYKYKFDPSTGEFLLHKRLPAGAVFPFDFGFIPSTQAEDGDPLDVLVLLDEPSCVGAVVPIRLIGVIQGEQTEDGQTVRNDRLVAVLETRYNPPPLRALGEVDEHVIGAIEHFFASYNEAEGRVFKSLGRAGPEQALERVRNSQVSSAGHEVA
jgi:inorganic pyrophosphatase